MFIKAGNQDFRYNEHTGKFKLYDKELSFPFHAGKIEPHLKDIDIIAKKILHEMETRGSASCLWYKGATIDNGYNPKHGFYRVIEE